MSRHSEIQNAYKYLGKEATFYDGMITCSTLPGKGLGNVQFRQGDAGKLPFADDSFDLVLSLNRTCMYEGTYQHYFCLS